MSPSQRHPSRRHPDVDARRQAALERLGPMPFRAADALKAGLTRSDLRSDAVHLIRHGVYADARHELDLPMRCAGLLLGRGPDVRIGSFTAAALLELPAPYRDQVFLASRYLPRRVPPGVSGVRADPSYPPLTRRFNGLELPVSHPAAILTECASEIGLVDGVVLADAVLSCLGGTAASARAHWAGSTRGGVLSEIARLARCGSESPMESRLRLLLVLSGLPEPVMQFSAVIAGRTRRFDLAYPERRVAVEYDGGHHYASEGQKHADILRAQEAAAQGWVIITVVSHGIYRDPAGTVGQVQRVLADRGLACHVTPGWQRYFPGALRR